jgi:hypothetical protein
LATPAFIYLFDNLGYSKFNELCALLIGSKYKGFLVSGPGPDGGIDAENDISLGELRPEENALLVDEIISPQDFIVFQFKHMVVARVGQSNTRAKLLNLYRSTRNRVSEVCKPEVKKRNPKSYFLVTNVEVNSDFRSQFAKICHEENPNIENYQVIGLDDLEAWVTMDRRLRAQYFPFLFGHPRYNLKIVVQSGMLGDPSEFDKFVPTDRFLGISVLNTGEGTSYVSSIKFKYLSNGKIMYAMPSLIHPYRHDPMANPKFGEPIPPGKRQDYRYLFKMFHNLKAEANGDFFLSDIMVWDEIDNVYSVSVTDNTREELYPTEKNTMGST